MENSYSLHRTLRHKGSYTDSKTNVKPWGETSPALRALSLLSVLTLNAPITHLPISFSFLCNTTTRLTVPSTVGRYFRLEYQLSDSHSTHVKESWSKPWHTVPPQSC